MSKAAQQLGRVLKSTGKWYKIKVEDGSVIDCTVRGKMRLEGLRTTNPIAVGDEVIFEEMPDEFGKGVIVSYKLRQNYIVRKSTNLSKQMHILAANVDRAYLLVTIKNPETYTTFIDRFLVAAESFRIPVTILFNKVDLLNEKELDTLKELMNLYQHIGYPCNAISATSKSDILFLKEEINQKQVMIAGHSGTGKSTLVNCLDPLLDLRIGEISQAHSQGQHTTTFAEMHSLSSGGYIIDTPGIRAFGVVNLEKEVISHYFPEMRNLIGACKYHNCLHLNEPNCEVKNEIERGKIAISRYNTYLQLILEDETEVHRRGRS